MATKKVTVNRYGRYYVLVNYEGFDCKGEDEAVDIVKQYFGLYPPDKQLHVLANNYTIELPKDSNDIVNDAVINQY